MIVLHLIWEAVHAPLTLWVLSCVNISCYLSEILQKLKYSEWIESPNYMRKCPWWWRHANESCLRSRCLWVVHMIKWPWWWQPRDSGGHWGVPGGSLGVPEASLGGSDASLGVDVLAIDHFVMCTQESLMFLWSASRLRTPLTLFKHLRCQLVLGSLQVL